MKTKKTAEKQKFPKIRGICEEFGKKLRSGESDEYLNIESSISDSCTTEQANTTFFSYSSHNLIWLIQQQRLTDCLGLLEELGYVGDSAIFVLASLQRGAAV